MYANVNREPSEGVPLPRGRHKLTREHVRESQRSRLVAAMLECVGEQGYPPTTVADVVARARVSRNAFYAFFEDREACYLEACDQVGAQMLAELYTYAAAPTWTGAVREGMRAYLNWWQARPGYSVAYLVDLPTAGRRALEQRDRVYARFVAMFEAIAARARTEQPELPPLSPLAPRLIVTAITEIVAQEIRAGRLEALPELEDELVQFVVETLGQAG